MDNSYTGPKTVDEIVEWFSGTHDPLQLRMLVESMLAKPDPLHLITRGMEHPPVTCAKAWNWVLDYDLLYLNAKTGWLTPDGTFYSAAYAAHERLLYWLGHSCQEVEEMGWARTREGMLDVSYQCRFRLSAKQRSWMKKNGFEIDQSREMTNPILKKKTN